MFYAEELLGITSVRFPGAGRIRNTEPGGEDSNPVGAVYQGSSLGGRVVFVTGWSAVDRPRMADASRSCRREGIFCFDKQDQNQLD